MALTPIRTFSAPIHITPGTITAALLATSITYGGTWTFSNPVTGATPTAGGHLTTKTYVDSLFNGKRDKGYVRASTTAALPSYTHSGGVLTASANGALPAQDGVTLVVNDSLVVVFEAGANEKYNGAYVVTAVGDGSNPFVLTRRSDSNSDALVNPGDSYFVSEGTVYADHTWTLITDEPMVLGTTALTFTLTSGAGQIIAGAALVKTGNQLDVQVDNSTIEVNSDALRLKALGITNSHISSSAAIDWSKISKIGSSLADLATRAASDLTVTPTGNLAASNAQAAFNELQGDIDSINTAAGNLQTEVNAIETALGAMIGSDGTFQTTALDTGNYMDASTTVTGALLALDTQIKANSDAIAGLPAAMTWYRAVIETATGGETTLTKAGGDPAIPDDHARVQFFIDGRKVFKGVNSQFTVDGGGGGITFVALEAGQSAEVLWFA